MDIEKVTQDLNRRFAAPLPEYYHRRIIFWHDEDMEFEDKLDEIQLDNAKLVALNGNNTFMVKKLLSNDDLASNYLVYNPLSFDKPDDDWLIDVKLYSEEFRADLISMWMDEMGLVSNFSMRKEVKHYRKFFNAKDRRAKPQKNQRSCTWLSWQQSAASKNHSRIELCSVCSVPVWIMEATLYIKSL